MSDYSDEDDLYNKPSRMQRSRKAKKIRSNESRDNDSIRHEKISFRRYLARERENELMIEMDDDDDDLYTR